MGEVAEDMIDGSCCALCGCYFQDTGSSKDEDSPLVFSHGYPVACRSCWSKNCGYEKALVRTF